MARSMSDTLCLQQRELLFIWSVGHVSVSARESFSSLVIKVFNMTACLKTIPYYYYCHMYSNICYKNCVVLESDVHTQSDLIYFYPLVLLLNDLHGTIFIKKKAAPYVSPLKTSWHFGAQIIYFFLIPPGHFCDTTFMCSSEVPF